jgi:putative membrane protein
MFTTPEFSSAVFRVGAVNFLIAFLTAGAFVVAFKLIYQLVTPYHEGRLIKAGNTPATIGLWGAVLGYVLPLASALSHTVSLVEFIAWASLAAVIQIVAFLIVRQLALPDVKTRIEAGDLSAGIYMAGVSLAVGLLNAACITD